MKFRKQLPADSLDNYPSVFDDLEEKLGLQTAANSKLFQLAIELLRLADNSQEEAGVLRTMKRYKDSHNRLGQALGYRRSSDLALMAILGNGPHCELAELQSLAAVAAADFWAPYMPPGADDDIP